MVIYFCSTVITKVMLLYNTEWWFYYGMIVKYRGKKLYNIGARDQCYKKFTTVIYHHFQDFAVILYKKALLPK